MKNRRKLTQLVVVALAIAATAALILSGGPGQFFGAKDNSRKVVSVEFELMPESSSEFSRRHLKGANGKDLELHIQYRDKNKGAEGDRGVQKFRTDGTLSEFRVEFRNGGDRMHAFYSQDGKTIIRGFRLREDRSPWWKTETLSDGRVKTLIYWADGTTVFAEEFRTLDGPDSTKVITQYNRENGMRWVKQTTLTSDKTKVLDEDLWNEQGQMVYSRVTTKDGGSEVTWFGENNLASFKQIWGTYTEYYGGDYEGMYGEGGYSTTSTVIKKIEEYGADGAVTRAIQMSDDGKKAVKVTLFKPDGSRQVLTLNDDLTASKVENFDKDGKSLPEGKPDGAKVEIAQDLFKEQPKPVDPITAWGERELAVHSGR